MENLITVYRYDGNKIIKKEINKRKINKNLDWFNSEKETVELMFYRKNRELSEKMDELNFILENLSFMKNDIEQYNCENLSFNNKNPKIIPKEKIENMIHNLLKLL